MAIFSSDTTTIAPLSSMTRRMRLSHCSVYFYTPLLLPTASLCSCLVLIYLLTSASHHGADVWYTVLLCRIPRRSLGLVDVLACSGAVPADIVRTFVSKLGGNADTTVDEFKLFGPRGIASVLRGPAMEGNTSLMVHAKLFEECRIL